MAPVETRIVHFAAMIAAVKQVISVANGDHVDATLEAALLASVQVRNPKEAIEVFPDVTLLGDAARSGIEMLQGRRNDVIAPYMLRLMELADRLRENEDITTRLAERLDALPSDAVPSHQALADTYEATISKLGKRIQVRGEPELLQQPRVAARIRALLLAGIRHAWSWRAQGGRKSHLLLQRRALLKELQRLLPA